MVEAIQAHRVVLVLVVLVLDVRALVPRLAQFWWGEAPERPDGSSRGNWSLASNACTTPKGRAEPYGRDELPLVRTFQGNRAQQISDEQELEPTVPRPRAPPTTLPAAPPKAALTVAGQFPRPDPYAIPPKSISMRV